MNRSNKIMAIACVGLALGVAIGAFGAHGLKDLLASNGRIDTFETAVKYQMYHMLGLLILGFWSKEDQKKTSLIASLFIVGTTIFSGSLYVLCFSGITWLGAITPIGGLLFIIAWSLWAFYLIKK